jgi:YHS domain-containing protein
MAEERRESCRVCGREVAPEAGIRESYEGHRCCFCSPECQARFEADPEQYLGETQCLTQPPGYW